VQPGATDLQIAAEPVVGPHPSAQSFTRFQYDNPKSGLGEFPRGDQTGDATADHDDVCLLCMAAGHRFGSTFCDDDCQ
jgi:hypothetical protein